MRRIDIVKRRMLKKINGKNGMNVKDRLLAVKKKKKKKKKNV